MLGLKDYRIQDRVNRRAPVNFAMTKYWGKESEELVIPVTGSTSYALDPSIGTETKISLSDRDQFFLNGKEFDPDAKEFKRTFDFVNLFKSSEIKLKIETVNSIPTAAGLASSASGFAALTKALYAFFNWDLGSNETEALKKLSIFARLGSGSASRSLYPNQFVELIKDGALSYSQPMEVSDNILKKMRMGICVVDAGEKKWSSGEGMRRSMQTKLYQYGWVKQCEEDMKDLKAALKTGDFDEFFEVVLRNAEALHGTAVAAGVYYSTDATNAIKLRVYKLRADGVRIVFTQDAGPNLKILSDDADVIKEHFPQAKIVL
jgi:diphosphomevalonate decarboxylase